MWWGFPHSSKKLTCFCELLSISIDLIYRGSLFFHSSAWMRELDMVAEWVGSSGFRHNLLSHTTFRFVFKHLTFHLLPSHFCFTSPSSLLAPKPFFLSPDRLYLSIHPSTARNIYTYIHAHPVHIDIQPHPHNAIQKLRCPRFSR